MSIKGRIRENCANTKGRKKERKDIQAMATYSDNLFVFGSVNDL